MRETKLDNPAINAPGFYLNGGDIEVSDEDPGWGQETGGRVFRHLVELASTVPVNHLGATRPAPYAPRQPPLIMHGFNKLAGMSGNVSISVDVEPFARHDAVGRIGDSLDRFWLVIRVGGPGKLKVIRAWWQAIMIAPRGDGN